MANPIRPRLVISLLVVLGSMSLPAQCRQLQQDAIPAQINFLFDDSRYNSSSSKAVSSGKPLLPAMFVLGDSTVDSGNNNDLSFTVFKANFYPYGKDFPNHEATGRFCNGYLSVDYIAEEIGLPLALPYFNNRTKTSDYDHGINFASAGSGTIASTAAKVGTIHLKTQVDAYLNNYRKRLIEEVGKAKATNIRKEGLYIISTGTNDYLNNYMSDPALQARLSPGEFQDQMVQSLVSSLESLHGGGARRIAVLSMIPLGCLPSQKTRFAADIINGSECVGLLNDFAKAFNSKLQKALDQLQARFADSIIRFAEIYDKFDDMYKHPAKYGMKYTRDACCGLGLYEAAIACNAGTELCADASQYIFWDSFHPSQKTYKVLADYLWEEHSTALLEALPP